MGVGPAVAIPAAVKAAGLELEDIDLFEINEVKRKECFTVIFQNQTPLQGLTKFCCPHQGICFPVCLLP